MNTHYTMRTFLVASLLILQIGCVPIPWRFSKQQLVGIYEIDYPFGRDTLVLRGDDTYEQRFTDRDGRTFINRGKWTLEHRWDNQGGWKTPFWFARLSGSLRPLKRSKDTLFSRPVGMRAGLCSP